MFHPSLCAECVTRPKRHSQPFTSLLCKFSGLFSYSCRSSLSSWGFRIQARGFDLLTIALGLTMSVAGSDGAADSPGPFMGGMTPVSCPGTPSMLGLRMQPQCQSVASASSVSGPPASSVADFPLLKFANSGSKETFLCCQCKSYKPVIELVTKGHSSWCRQDNSSYNQLTLRWKVNTKLRKWWQSLSDDQKVAWFIRWQNIETKRRFQFLQYIEKTVEAQEILDDEVDEFIPYATFFRERIIEPGMNAQLIEKAFKDEVENCRSECKFLRGEWLLPRFAGFRRTHRRIRGQYVEGMRTANLSDPAAMEQLWNGGKQQLIRFADSVQPTQTAEPSVRAPFIESTVADMPAQVVPQDGIRNSIQREAAEFHFRFFNVLMSCFPCHVFNVLMSCVEMFDVLFPYDTYSVGREFAQRRPEAHVGAFGVAHRR